MNTQSPISANRRSLAIDVSDSALAGAVDIRVSGRRVWSVPVPTADRAGKVRLLWPRSLVPYLRGRATIEVRNSATGDVVASSTVQFGRLTKPVEVRNHQGRWLVVDKWGRMSPNLETDQGGVRERLLTRSKTLTDHLTRLGYAVGITSGTLLGAVRAGDMLQHDDDVDLAVLLDNSHPSDLALKSYRLEDELVELGYTVVRHSTAHLQLIFLRENGLTDHYIDIFIAFYRGDDFCQPFHIREPVPRSSVAPTATMELAGVPFPAPAAPADWLAACYGPDWQTPDPSFRFETPMPTRRRFDNWFGSQHANRTYWESRYAQRDTPVPIGDGDARHLRALSRLLPTGAPVVDIGCGTGTLSSVIADHSHDVIGIDYSYRALAIARDVATSRLDLRFLNVYDRRRLLEFGAELVRAGRAWHFNLSHVMAGLTVEGRRNIYLFLHLVLADGAFAFSTDDTHYARLRFEQENPETWHLPVDWLRAESAPYGLEVNVVESGSRRTAMGRRSVASTVIRRAQPNREPTEGART